MKKGFLTKVAFIAGVAATAAFADAPTDFATSLPASLIPDGFWSLVGLVFTAAATIWGITRGLRLLKRA